MRKSNYWQGEVVTEAIGLGIDESTDRALPLQSLVGVAFRENPKRAHLLVSKVLGKHYPQSPTVIKSAASILAYQLYAHSRGELSYGELEPEYLSRVLNMTLTGEDRNVVLREIIEGVDIRDEINDLVVFGYAETATALGAAFADAIGASYYINSTRYPDDDSQEYGGFEEEHSHATSHHLTPRDTSYLDNPNTVLALVDDELTTGNTMLNTIRMMQDKARRRTYYIVTLVDLRDAAARSVMDAFAAEQGIEIKVFSLYSGSVDVPADAIAKAQPVIAGIKAGTPERSHGRNRAAVFTVKNTISAPNGRNGLTDFAELNAIASQIASRAAKLVHGKTLVLGIEEDMYLSLQVAYALEGTHGIDVDYSTSTRSPVLAYDHEGYAIRDRIKYSVPEVEGDTEKRFAYNIGSGYKSIIIVSSNKTETSKLTNPNGLVDALRERTKNIFIMESVIDTGRLQKPLTSPEFGSYKPEDVQWLLKDLSHAEIEGTNEDREKLMQGGKTHYAESLPIEYQPTAEYQQLFLDVLEESKGEVALLVGRLAEQIYRQRNANPVLVSLARAGVPVAILVKRYLEAAYDVEIPHYSISIVRGKGIDRNALGYILANHPASSIMVVDGWTGKGFIKRELDAALAEYAEDTGIVIPNDLAVLSDPASSTTIYGTRSDVLLPSACLNSTVSGLISRTVLNEAYIGKNDYHGAKFYKEFADNDYSNLFIDTVSELFTTDLFIDSSKFVDGHTPETADFAGWKSLEKINVDYGINDMNLVKSSLGECTRVLLRRKPKVILIRTDRFDDVLHIRLLAEDRGVPIELIDDLPYAAVGLIQPIAGQTQE